MCDKKQVTQNDMTELNLKGIRPEVLTMVRDRVTAIAELHHASGLSPKLTLDDTTSYINKGSNSPVVVITLHRVRNEK